MIPWIRNLSVKLGISTSRTDSQNQSQKAKASRGGSINQTNNFYNGGAPEPVPDIFVQIYGDGSMKMFRTHVDNRSGRMLTVDTITLNGEVTTLNQAVSSRGGVGKDFRHAEVRAIESAIELADRGLQGAALYASMEPCLMCLTTAYWAGIRKIVYAVRRSEVDPSYYESSVIATEDLRKALNQDIELVHVSGLEHEALDVAHEWETTIENSANN